VQVQAHSWNRLVFNIRLRVDGDGNWILLRAEHPLQTASMAVGKDVTNSIKPNTNTDLVSTLK